MKKKLPVICATAIILITFVGSHACAEYDFHEDLWRKKIESARVEDLYAPNYRQGRFFNPWLPQEHRGLWRYLKWKLLGRGDNPAGEKKYLPPVIPGAVERIMAMPAGDFILWVGHATFLMRIGGEYWLTDPIFSKRALLPKRVTPPAIDAAGIKALGIAKLNVVISHNHHDHLDKSSIEALPDDARFYVPQGLKRFFTELGKKDIVEMNWWQSADHAPGIRVVCLPAQHWSRRIGQDANETLWASFLIIAPSVKVYFAGDSGYFIGYREIGRRFPGIDYALMPVTAYSPRWFMHYAHMDVDEVIDAFDDTGARFFIPTQWGAFQLGDNPTGETAAEIRRKITARKLDASRFIIMDIGGIVPLRRP